MKHLITIFGLFFSLTAYSETEHDIWANTDTISTDLYEFQVPTVWRNLGNLLMGGQGPEQYFEASGKGLPVIFNGGPVQVTIFLAKLDQTNFKDAKKSTIDGYFSNTDRVFNKKDEYEEEALTLSDNSEAILLNTRFYRNSNGLNQSRYDLVTYSKKNKLAYMFTVSIQYVDKTYVFEKEYDLKEYAKNLFSTYKWK